MSNIENHQEECNGGSSGRHYQESIDSWVNYPPVEASFNPTSMETRNLALNMFPDTPSTRLNAILTVSSNWEDAVDLLVNNEKPTEYGLDEVLKKYQGEMIESGAPMQHLVVQRDDVWRDGVRFYKMTIANKEMLKRPLVVEFKGEEGVDGGALKVEFFSKFFDAICKRMFEQTPNEQFLIPKRSGANLQVFKIIGVAIGHSLAQGGPPFPYFPPWCFAIISGKEEEDVVSSIAKESFKDSIPQNEGTSNLLQFLNELENVKSTNAITQLLDEAAEGPAYEQLINASQWPIDEKITLENREALMSMLIWDELVARRENQLKAVREDCA